MQYHIVKSLTTLIVRFPKIPLVFLAGLTSLSADQTSEVVFKVPEARSAFAPSAAYFDGRIFLGWRGAGTPDLAENDQELYLAAAGTEGWDRLEARIGQSMFGPVLACLEEKLFIAWHAPGNLFTGTGDPRIYLAYMNRGGQIHHLGAVPAAVSAGPPGLAVHQGLVYVGWRAAGNITVGTVSGNQHWINFGVYDPEAQAWLDGKGGGGNIVHANGTSGPTFASVGERLFVLWRGTGSITFYGPNTAPGDPFIYYGALFGGKWSTRELPLPKIPEALTAWSPGAVEWRNQLLVAWRGDQAKGEIPGDSSLSFALFDENQEWRKFELFVDSKPRSAFAPSMAVDGKEGRLWVFWRGDYERISNTNDQQIYGAIVPGEAAGLATTP